MLYYAIFHALCFFYCIWRFVKRYNKTSHDGVIGMYPAFDAFMALLFAPLFTIVDIIVTWVYMYIEWKQNKDNDKKIL